MTKTNEVKLMNVNELAAMTVKRETENGEKIVKLVNFVTDRQYIDVDSEVEKDYSFPCIKAMKNGKPVIKDGKEIYHPVYYVVKLAVTFAKDAKNDTSTADKEVRKANNEAIMKNAVGFKAVCRDLTALAGSKEKGFLKLTASLPCSKEVNMNETVTGLWLFTSKELREKFLKMVQIGIIENKYHIVEGSKNKAKRRSKRIEQIAEAFGISYEEAENKMKSIKK